ncbi:MAG TPA: PKD domain-containing protein [Microthrixaceae bacterium]|nr:PKD domain-containing protein [Microthrixaceae bacterium]
MSLLETLIGVTLSGLLISPMMAWAAVSMQQQRAIVQRNLSGASLGVLRTVFTRDVLNADRVWVDGEHLADCRVPDKGADTLMVLVTGDRHTTYAVVPDPDDGGSRLVRAQCPRAGAVAALANELVGDVLPAGTDVTCATGAQLEELSRTFAADAQARGAEVSAVPDGERRGADAGRDPDSSACGHVTLRLSTSALEQVALSASVRPRGTLAVPEPPVAAISARPVAGPRPLAVTFDGSGSSDPRGTELTFNWDFGDGTTGTGVRVRHDYTRTGPITATLTVTTPSGRRGSTTVVVDVADNVPVAAIAEPRDGTKVFRGQKVGFSSKGSGDPLDAPFGGRVVSYRWDFGDGTGSTEADPVKVFSRSSPPTGFPVVLTVTDDAGRTAVARTGLIVVNRAPTVALAAAPESGTGPLTVTFSAVVGDEPDLEPAPPLKYSWDFGNGSTSDRPDPGSVLYPDAGTYTARLTVTDDEGLSATATRTVVVAAPGPAAPANLRLLRVGSLRDGRFVEMDWSRSPVARRYELQLSCVACVEQASAQTTSTQLRIRGLPEPSRAYDARVRAMDRDGVWGPWSAPVRVTS